MIITSDQDGNATPYNCDILLRQSVSNTSPSTPGNSNSLNNPPDTQRTTASTPAGEKTGGDINSGPPVDDTSPAVSPGKSSGLPAQPENPTALDDKDKKKDFNYDVPGEVQWLAQTTNTCWAASATMMISWRDHKKYSITEVMDKAGPRWREKFDKNETLNGGAEKLDFLASLRLHGEAEPVNYPIEGLLSLLQCHGPIWVTFSGNEKNSTHARVVTGLRGRVDTKPNSSYSYDEKRTLVKVNDPFGPDASEASHRYTMTFELFRQWYEKVKTDGNHQMQMVWNG